ncbi:vegetative cell wall protein gp1-like isoform X1 [Vigna radiata var. radiata]|uniref:Vegetative cell wall protein gp1-like isoform X1 n=1 Tax=Vigna radiata var. radiata TaxID=3916 RepID=A0A3Q0FDR0_VIGRR|nr:vegetative cell wall protein gp1-like isoform X1 [Vigna radiata var. radiata]
MNSSGGLLPPMSPTPLFPWLLNAPKPPPEAAPANPPFEGTAPANPTPENPPPVDATPANPPPMAVLVELLPANPRPKALGGEKPLPVISTSIYLVPMLTLHQKPESKKSKRTLPRGRILTAKEKSGLYFLEFDDQSIILLRQYHDTHAPFSTAMAQTKCDINLDGDIEREEFFDFMLQMTADTFTVVSQKLVVTMVVASTVAVATKKATEGVPGVGKVVKKIPNSVCASLAIIAAVWFKKKAQSSSL